MTEISIQFGQSLEEKILISLAQKDSRFAGCKIENAAFVWGETFNDDGTTKKMGKSHAMVSGEDKNGNELYRTFCGIDDRCGNWHFAFPFDFESEDECKRCVASIKKLENK